MKLARDVMSTKVWTAAEDTDLQTLLKMLKELEISGAPVLDRHGRPVGVVSLYDLANLGGREFDPDAPSQYWGSHSQPRGFHQLGEGRGHLKVADIMTQAVHSVEENTTIDEVCDFFIRGQIHRVLVTRQGELVGIITATDLLQELKNLLAASTSMRS